MSTYINLYLKTKDKEPVMMADFGGGHELFRDLYDSIEPSYNSYYNKDTGEIESQDSKKEVTISQLDDALDDLCKSIKWASNRVAVYKEILTREDRDEFFRLKALGREREYPFEFESGGDNSDEWRKYFDGLKEATEVVRELISDEEYIADCQRKVGQVEMLRHILYCIKEESWTGFDSMLCDLS